MDREELAKRACEKTGAAFAFVRRELDIEVEGDRFPPKHFSLRNCQRVIDGITEYEFQNLVMAERAYPNRLLEHEKAARAEKKAVVS